MAQRWVPGEISWRNPAYGGPQFPTSERSLDQHVVVWMHLGSTPQAIPKLWSLIGKIECYGRLPITSHHYFHSLVPLASCLMGRCHRFLGRSLAWGAKIPICISGGRKHDNSIINKRLPLPSLEVLHKCQHCIALLYHPWAKFHGVAQLDRQLRH